MKMKIEEQFEKFKKNLSEGELKRIERLSKKFDEEFLSEENIKKTELKNRIRNQFQINIF